MLSLIGGASFITTNKNLSRNEEGVEKNNLCTPKQIEIKTSFVSLFGGHIVLFPFLSTQQRLSRIIPGDAVLRRRHLPHPGVLHGHGPRLRAQCHAETRVVSRVTCPAVASILADTDPEAWPLTYICSMQQTLVTVPWTWCHHHSASPSPSSDM